MVVIRPARRQVVHRHGCGGRTRHTVEIFHKGQCRDIAAGSVGSHGDGGAGVGAAAVCSYRNGVGGAGGQAREGENSVVGSILVGAVADNPFRLGACRRPCKVD